MRLGIPVLTLATCGALAAGLVVSPAVTAAPEPRATVPIPAITPIPGERIFTGALQDLTAVGYAEREYAVTVADPKV